MSRMLSKMNLISVIQRLPKEDIEIIQGYVEMIEEENQELKKQLDEYKGSHYCRFIDICKSTKIANYNQQKEFILYLENEKDRLARECSQIYEDSLGKTRLVNEDIFNEVNDILQKYKSIIGVLDEKSNNISS